MERWGEQDGGREQTFAEARRRSSRSRRLADRGTRDALPERERRCAHGATRPMERVLTRSVEIRERERRRPASSDRYDWVTVRFTLSVCCFPSCLGLSRAVRLLGRFSVRPAVGRAVAGGERRCGVVCCFVCLSHPPTLGGSLLSEFDVLGPWAWRVFSAGVCRCLWTRDPVAIRRL